MESMASQNELQPQSDGIMNARTQSMDRGEAQENKEATHHHQPDEGRCSLLGPRKDGGFDGLYDRRMSCFGCGIGWFCFILGFAFPLLWYIATALYFGKYYLRDPRERAGLAASAIAALICSFAVTITLLSVFL